MMDSEYWRATMILETPAGRFVYFMENIKAVEMIQPLTEDEAYRFAIDNRIILNKEELHIKIKMKSGLEPTVTVIKEKL